MGSLYETKSACITPPFAGSVSAITTSTSAGTQDLSLCGNQTITMGNSGQQPMESGTQPQVSLNGGINQFVEFYADTSDVGVVFGSTLASVSGSNAPALATTGIDTAGVCARIPAGTYRTYYISQLSRWVGFVGAAAGTLRISVTSRGG